MKQTEELKRIAPRREAHFKALEDLAGQVGCQQDGELLWRLLGRLEKRVYACCLKYTNEGYYGIDRWEMDKANAKKELAAIFGGKIPAGIFINGDPRGHILKLDSETVKIPEGMQTDWGQDGILAAEN